MCSDKCCFEIMFPFWKCLEHCFLFCFVPRLCRIVGICIRCDAILNICVSLDRATEFLVEDDDGKRKNSIWIECVTLIIFLGGNIVYKVCIGKRKIRCDTFISCDGIKEITLISKIMKGLMNAKTHLTATAKVFGHTLLIHAGSTLITLGFFFQLIFKMYTLCLP